MKKLFVLALIIGLSVPSMGQITSFLEKDKSGLFVQAGGSNGVGLNGYLWNLGYTCKGKYTLEVYNYMDTYEQETMGLLDNNASSNNYGIYLTWWCIREQVSNNVDLNFGLKPGFEFASYKNYRYYSSGGNVIDYKSYGNGILGMQANVVFHTKNNWMLQPGINMAYYAGSDKATELNVDKTSYYTDACNAISMMVAKKFNNGSALSFTVKEYMDSYSPGQLYDFELGYVLPFK